MHNNRYTLLQENHKWPTIALLLTIASGILFAWWMVDQAEKETRHELLQQARLVAKSINIKQIQELSGTKADLHDTGYLQLKKQLARARQLNPNCKFLYIMGQRVGGEVFFFVDSLPTNSENYTAPGQIYSEVSPAYLQAFETRQETVVGPITDRWGILITALVPIGDPKTDEVVAMLGMDIGNSSWKWNILAKSALPVGLVLALLFILMAGLVASISQPKSSTKPIMYRLLLPLTAILVLLVAGFTAIVLSVQQRHFTQDNQQILHEASAHLANRLADQATTLATLGLLFTDNTAMQQALQGGDRHRLLTAYQSTFAQLRDVHAITHLYFHLPDRVNLLRLHNPEKHGDLINRFTMLEAERTGQVAAGIELGPLGTFTLRSVQPLFAAGKLIGYLELGKEIEDLLTTIHDEHNVELFVSIYKTALQRSQWETGMAMLGREANWGNFAEKVIIYSSFSHFPTACARFIAEEEHSHYSISPEVKFNNATWRVLVSPLTDVSGAEVGDLVILNNVSAAKASFARLLVINFSLGLVLLTALLGSLFILLRRTDLNIRQQQELLRQNQDFSQSIINTAQVIIIVLDTEGRIVNFNPFMEEVSGYSLAEVKGKDWIATMVPKRDSLRIRHLFKQAMSGIQTKGNRNTIRSKAGHDISVEWYDKTLMAEDGTITGLLATGILLHPGAPEETHFDNK